MSEQILIGWNDLLLFSCDLIYIHVEQLTFDPQNRKRKSIESVIIDISAIRARALAAYLFYIFNLFKQFGLLP